MKNNNKNSEKIQKIDKHLFVKIKQIEFDLFDKIKKESEWQIKSEIFDELSNQVKCEVDGELVDYVAGEDLKKAIHNNMKDYVKLPSGSYFKPSNDRDSNSIFVLKDHRENRPLLPEETEEYKKYEKLSNLILNCICVVNKARELNVHLSVAEIVLEYKVDFVKNTRVEVINTDVSDLSEVYQGILLKYVSMLDKELENYIENK